MQCLVAHKASLFVKGQVQLVGSLQQTKPTQSSTIRNQFAKQPASCTMPLIVGMHPDEPDVIDRPIARYCHLRRFDHALLCHYPVHTANPHYSKHEFNIPPKRTPGETFSIGEHYQRTGRVVFRNQHMAKIHTFVNGIGHQLTHSYRTIIILQDQMVDTHIVLKTSGQDVHHPIFILGVCCNHIVLNKKACPNIHPGNAIIIN